MSEKRALNSTELSETLLDDETEDQSLASCLRVYDVEKLDDDVELVSKVSLSSFELCIFSSILSSSPLTRASI